MFGFQRSEHVVAGADGRFEQQAGHDGQLVAECLGLQQVDVGCLAAPDHIQQARTAHQFRHGSDFFHRLRRFQERHVGPGFQRRVRSADRFLEPDHGARVGARDYHEIRVAPRMDGGADFGDPVFARDQFLVVEMAAALGRNLIFDMDSGDARALVILDGADDVEFVAVTGVGIGDQGHFDRAHHAGGVGDHFGFRQQAEIGITVRDGRARARHINQRKACLFHKPSGKAVVGTGRDEHAGFAQQGAEFRGLIHGVVSSRLRKSNTLSVISCFGNIAASARARVSGSLAKNRS